MSAPLVTCGLHTRDRDTVAQAAERYDRAVHHADTPEGFRASANGDAPALIFASATDFAIAPACADWRARYPSAAIVCCAQNDEFDTKLDALEAGADQFLVTPIEEEALEFILRFCLVEQGR